MKQQNIICEQHIVYEIFTCHVFLPLNGSVKNCLAYHAKIVVRRHKAIFFLFQILARKKQESHKLYISIQGKLAGTSICVSLLKENQTRRLTYNWHVNWGVSFHVLLPTDWNVNRYKTTAHCWAETDHRHIRQKSCLGSLASNSSWIMTCWVGLRNILVMGQRPYLLISTIYTIFWTEEPN